MPDIQLKRGNEAAVAAYVGPAGEIVVDSQNWNLALQDGQTPGGVTVGSNSSTIAPPEIVSPLSGAVLSTGAPVIVTSAFAGTGVHLASRFQFATDALFTNIVHDSGRDTTNLLQYSLVAAGYSLPYGGTYYIRASHESSEAGDSGFGAAVQVSVIAIGPGAVIDGDIVVGQIDGDWLLIAPATKRSTPMSWGLMSIDTTLPNIASAESADPNTGKYNTDILVSPAYNTANDGQGNNGCPPAKFCRNMGYDLPNKEELKLIYQRRALIDADDTSGGSNTLAALAAYDQLAWSSTEGEVGSAWAHRFSDNHVYKQSKTAGGFVLPVLRIPV